MVSDEIKRIIILPDKRKAYEETVKSQFSGLVDVSNRENGEINFSVLDKLFDFHKDYFLPIMTDSIHTLKEYFFLRKVNLNYYTRNKPVWSDVFYGVNDFDIRVFDKSETLSLEPMVPQGVFSFEFGSPYEYKNYGVAGFFDIERLSPVTKDVHKVYNSIGAFFVESFGKSADMTIKIIKNKFISKGLEDNLISSLNLRRIYDLRNSPMSLYKKNF